MESYMQKEIRILQQTIDLLKLKYNISEDEIRKHIKDSIVMVNNDLDKLR